MSRIQGASLSQLRQLNQSVKEALRSCTSFEAAAQRGIDKIYEEFSDSIRLLRLYATTTAQKLPEELNLFASQLSGSALQPSNQVFVLFGTRGALPEWSQRDLSKKHAAIPLLNSSFVKTLPMLDGLLQEMGTKLDWLDTNTELLGKSLEGGLASVFYVKDAATERDAKDRLLIPAQDFVQEHQIKTVFGVGSSYMNGQFLVMLFFCNEFVSREQAEHFIVLANVIKLSTLSLISGQLF
jgi:hypothetical protein